MNADQIPNFESPVCPLPLAHSEQIVISHGSGGRQTHDLIRKVFNNRFSNPALDAGNDSAVLDLSAQMPGKIAVSTDAHIVSPYFFPGGDIGKLAVCGTVNDVAMSGAIPRYLTASFILEEGFPIRDLEKIVLSMEATAKEADVEIIAGDTKVVQKGKGDGIFISTTGIGWLPLDRQIGGEQARAGDVVILSGTIGEHGLAVLAARGELGFTADLRSDVAPLNHMIQAVLEAAPDIHVLRDPTRGGVATTLNEIASQSGVNIFLEEDQIPISPQVHAVCEMLGFDPLYVANEGKVIVICPPSSIKRVLEALHAHKYGQQARVIGEVRAAPVGKVLMRTMIAGTRIVDTLSGEMLPRIC